MRKKNLRASKRHTKKRRPTSQTKIHFRIVGKRTVSDEKRRSFTHTLTTHTVLMHRGKKRTHEECDKLVLEKYWMFYKLAGIFVVVVDICLYMKCCVPLKSHEYLIWIAVFDIPAHSFNINQWYEMKLSRRALKKTWSRNFYCLPWVRVLSCVCSTNFVVIVCVASCECEIPARKEKLSINLDLQSHKVSKWAHKFSFVNCLRKWLFSEIGASWWSVESDLIRICQLSFFSFDSVVCWNSFIANFNLSLRN